MDVTEHKGEMIDSFRKSLTEEAHRLLKEEGLLGWVGESAQKVRQAQGEEQWKSLFCLNPQLLGWWAGP